jgi:hypothetical protein
LFDVNVLDQATNLDWGVADSSTAGGCTVTADNGDIVAVQLVDTTGRDDDALSGAKSTCDSGTEQDVDVVDGGYVCEIHGTVSAGALFTGDHVLAAISAVSFDGASTDDVQTALVALLRSFVAPDSASSTASGENDGTASGSAVEVPIVDAKAARDALLAAAREPNAIDEIDAAGNIAVKSWRTTVPATYDGSEVTADANTVSGFEFVYSKTKDESYLAFATLDESGTCAGGVIALGPDDRSVVDELKIDDASECTGGAVGDAAGF